MNTTGTNTMQMQSVATKAGVAICWAPSRIARITGFPIARLRFVFSISTVASSTRMPTASASPPSVITLSVSPNSESVITETRMASGIDTTITSVDRHEPRKRRIMSPVSAAAMAASRSTPCTDARTNTDWSKSGLTSRSGGSVAWMRGSASFTRWTMSRVDAVGVFRTVSSAESRPSTWTMFVWTANPSRTWATSRM